MKKEEILNELEKIFKDVLENNEIEITNTTTANDIDEWDSLSHIMLVVAIESHFSVSFTSEEIISYKNIYDMCVALEDKIYV